MLLINSLKKAKRRIAIAALDPDFYITGFQIATLRTDPKYIWLSSANQGGSGPQLPNGELPLFCWKHPDAKKVKVVILCEGALKSLLTALFLWRQGQTDIAVIGTASAARYGEKTLKNYLKQLRAKEIRLMPDAGAIANSHIASSNQETLQRCRQWGYRLTVGDWGQLDNKQHLDIDELLAASRQNEIKLITSAAYFCQCHTYSQINQLLKLGSFHMQEDKLIELRPLSGSTENLDLIRQYANCVERCRKSGYRIVVAWNSETITPEDFFALCPESVQQQLAQSEREWALLYNLKLWLRRSTLATFGIPYQNIGSLEMLFLTLNKNIFTSGDRGTAGKNGDSSRSASHRALKGFYKQSSRPHD